MQSWMKYIFCLCFLTTGLLRLFYHLSFVHGEVFFVVSCGSRNLDSSWASSIERIYQPVFFAMRSFLFSLSTYILNVQVRAEESQSMAQIGGPPETFAVRAGISNWFRVFCKPVIGIEMMIALRDSTGGFFLSSSSVSLEHIRKCRVFNLPPVIITVYFSIY